MNPDNPGIHPNDVMQGGENDCYAIATIKLLAQIDYAKLKRLIKDLGGGSYKVWLWEGGTWKSVTYGPENLLTLGANGANLSGDADENGAEIWVNLIERRLADYMQANSRSLADGEVPECWTLLTGEALGAGVIKTVDKIKDSAGTLITDSSITDAQKDQLVYDGIKAGKDNGKFIIVGTRTSISYDTSPANNKPTPDKVYGRHAYILDEVLLDGLKLTNPHGRNHVDPLLKQYLFDYLVEWYEYSVVANSGPPAN